MVLKSCVAMCEPQKPKTHFSMCLYRLVMGSCCLNGAVSDHRMNYKLLPLGAPSPVPVQLLEW